MGRFAYAGGCPLYRVYAPRREYVFMEENGPVDHGRLRRKRCERGASFSPPWRPHECSWRIIVPTRPISLHSPRVFSIHLALNSTLSYNSSHATGGGTGRHSRLKICRCKACRFESGPGYHLFVSISRSVETLAFRGTCHDSNPPFEMGHLAKGRLLGAVLTRGRPLDAGANRCVVRGARQGLGPARRP